MLVEALKEIGSLPPWLQSWAVVAIVIGWVFVTIKGFRDKRAAPSAQEPPLEQPAASLVKTNAAAFDLLSHFTQIFDARFKFIDEALRQVQPLATRAESIAETLERIERILGDTKNVTHSAKNRGDRAVELIEELGHDLTSLARRLDEIARDGASESTLGEIGKVVASINERMTLALRRRGG